MPRQRPLPGLLHSPRMGAKQFTGTVRHNDLEGGFLELETDDGDVYRLQGGNARVGARVRVTGKIDRGGFGIHMTGPAIQVEKIEEI